MSPDGVHVQGCFLSAHSSLAVLNKPRGTFADNVVVWGSLGFVPSECCLLNSL